MSFGELRATAFFWLLPIGIKRALTALLDSWATSVWSDRMGTGRAAEIDAKTNFRIGNKVPKKGHYRGSYNTPLLPQCTKR